MPNSATFTVVNVSAEIPGSRQHCLPGLLIVTGTEKVGATNQRQAEQFRVPLDALQHLGIGHFKVLESGIDPRLPVAIQQPGKAEPVDEPPDFRRSHWLFREIDKMNIHAALFEEAFGGAGCLRVLYSEDLNQKCLPSYSFV